MRKGIAAVVVLVAVLAGWMVLHAHRPPPVPARPEPLAANLSVIPTLEKLKWGMTPEQVRKYYPRLSNAHAGGPLNSQYWLGRFEGRDCAIHATLLFAASDDGLVQVWLGSGPSKSGSCKDMTVTGMQRRYGIGLDQVDLAYRAGIPDCVPLKPNDRTWPPRMGGILRCWKNKDTVLQFIDRGALPLVFSKSGVPERPSSVGAGVGDGLYAVFGSN